MSGALTEPFPARACRVVLLEYMMPVKDLQPPWADDLSIARSWDIGKRAAQELFGDGQFLPVPVIQGRRHRDSENNEQAGGGVLS